MNKHLCDVCGAKINTKERLCHLCGAVNPYNKEISNERLVQRKQHEKVIQRYANSFLAASLIIGLILFISDIVLIIDFSSLGVVGILISTICSGMVVFLSILGLTKKEDVLKMILIFGFISIWVLLTTLWIFS